MTEQPPGRPPYNPPPPGYGPPPPGYYPPPPPGYGPPPPGYYGPPPPGQPPYGPPPGYHGPPRYEVGQAFSWAWAKFKTNAATVLTGGVILFLATIAVLAVAVALVFVVVPDPRLTFTDPQTGDIEGLGSYFATLGVAEGTLFLLSLPYAVIMAGFIRTGLRIADGEKPGIGSLFSYRNAPRIILTALIVSLTTWVGLILCYLPGLAFGVFATFTYFFVLDHGQGPIAAIKSSFAVVKGNFGSTVVAVILAGLVAMGGVLVCLVGVIFTAPFALLVHVYTYRFLSRGTITP